MYHLLATTTWIWARTMSAWDVFPCFSWFFFIRNYTKNRTEHKRIGLVTQYSLNRDDLRHSFTTRLLHSLIPATWFASKDASVFDLCHSLGKWFDSFASHRCICWCHLPNICGEDLFFLEVFCSWDRSILYISTSYILRSYICMPSEVGQGANGNFLYFGGCHQRRLAMVKKMYGPLHRIYQSKNLPFVWGSGS